MKFWKLFQGILPLPFLLIWHADGAAIVVSDGFAGDSLNTTLWHVEVPGATYAVHDGYLEVTDVSLLTEGWSGWHEGNISTPFPIPPSGDFVVEVRFDWMATQYQWLKIELLSSPDGADSNCAKIMIVRDPSYYIMGYSEASMVFWDSNPSTGPTIFRIERAAGVLNFSWDGVHRGSAPSTSDIDTLTMNFGRWSTTEFGNVRIDSIYAQSVNDEDLDGITDTLDNCPFIPNQSQSDADSDGIGDACDNCLGDYNPTQTDADGDGIGDICDACLIDPNNDVDGDGICGNVDNCPNVFNGSQADSDGDGVGDACDNCPTRFNPAQEETDGDGIADSCDNCPTVYNTSQIDGDGDGIGNACDACLTDPFNDEDGDGICHSIDNCPIIYNPDQADSNGNGIGDACDCQCPCHADPVCDTVKSDILDVVSTVNVAFRGTSPMTDPFCPSERTDVDCSGSTDVLDVVKTIDVAFRGADAAEKFCQPCGL